MVKNSLTLVLASAIGTVMTGCTSVGMSAPSHAHAHAEAAPALQLDQGMRWATDVPLRKAMGIINERVRDALPAIHEDRLHATHYAGLAVAIRAQVAYMIDNCKLHAEADAQLHLVIARLLEGASRMEGAPDSRHDGAVEVLGALQDYARHFADDGFVPISR